MLNGLMVAVDVQHVFRGGIHANDRGAVFTLADGSHVAEADCVMQYALTLANELRNLEATVWTNQPPDGFLTGPYSRRQECAISLGANLYLACHLNVGKGHYTLAEHMDGNVAGGVVAKAVTNELATLPGVKAAKVVALKLGDRGAVCIRGFTGPAVILEPLFGDTLSHQALLNHTGLEQVGQAIARGVANWWSQTRPLVA